MEQLTHWIRDSGGFISDKIVVQAILGRGNSVVALEKISQNEKLLSLPRKLLINVQSLEEPNLTSHQCLARHLLTEDSLWIKTLPESFDSIPLLWKDTELKFLPEKYQQHVARQKVQAALDHRIACPEFPFEKFLWAWLCVNSRCLYWNVGRERQENMTMAPFIDFLNHDSNQSKTVQVKSGLSMTLFASTDYNPGDEICLNYGPHENAFLLCEYGFVASRNVWDYIDLTPKLTPLLREHETALKDLGYWGDYTIDADGPSFRTLVACEALKNARLDLIVNGLRDPDPWSPVLSEALLELRTQFEQPTPRDELRSLYDGYLSIIHASMSKLGT